MKLIEVKDILSSTSDRSVVAVEIENANDAYLLANKLGRLARQYSERSVKGYQELMRAACCEALRVQDGLLDQLAYTSEDASYCYLAIDTPDWPECAGEVIRAAVNDYAIESLHGPFMQVRYQNHSRYAHLSAD